jgi:hypothetical protein
MNTRIPSLGRRDRMRSAITLAAAAGLLALRLVPLSSARAADAKPPEVMTYQGFLVDANGNPLAPSNPANYPVIFRIFDQATGGTRLWSEQQIVTIDKGNFSVLLGEGTEVSGESRPPLSQVFGGSGLAANASDRFLGVTVTINNVPTEILPRLRLLPAPYAYLARHANALVNAVGQPLVAAGSGDNLVVAGRLTANEFAGNGAALSDLDASKITSGTLSAARIPGLDAGKITTGTLGADRIPGLDAGKITSGTLADARLPGGLARRDQANIFTMNNQVNGHLRVGDIGNFPISSKGYGPALVFSGGPDLSNTWNNDNSDPLWMARYNEAENQTELRVVIGDDPGSSLDKFVVGTVQGGADFNQGGTWTPLVTVDARGYIGSGTAPSYPLHIKNNGTFRVGALESANGTGTWLQLFNTSAGGREWSLISSGSANSEGAGKLLIYTPGSGRKVEVRTDGLAVFGELWVSSLPFGDRKNVQWDNSSGRFFYDDSTRRHKENITPLRDDFSLLLKAQPMTYTRPGDPNRWEIGYIAEDFHDLGLTRLVDYDREGRPDGINYEKICLYLNENAKQQARELAELKATQQEQATVIAAQRTELDELKARVKSLEQLLRQVAAATAGLPPGTVALAPDASPTAD